MKANVKMITLLMAAIILLLTLLIAGCAPKAPPTPPLISSQVLSTLRIADFDTEATQYTIYNRLR